MLTVCQGLFRKFSVYQDYVFFFQQSWGDGHRD